MRLLFHNVWGLIVIAKRVAIQRAATTLVVLALGLGALVPRGDAPVATAAAVHAVPAQKSCKTVKKHGKNHKVCKSVTPNDVLAGQLADTVSRAATPSARRAALLAVAKAIHLGVYDTKTGKAEVKGAERGPDDFYLYTYELIPLAGALERKQMYSASDVAAELTAAGIKPNGKPVDPAAVTGLLKLAIGEAVSHPTQPFSLPRLLIRDLGLRHDHPQDLAQDIPSASVQFDALQYFLVVSDLLAPIVHSHAGGGSGARSTSEPRDLCRILGVLANPFSPTSYFDQLTLHYVLGSYISGQIADLISALAGAGKALEVLNALGTILDILHALVLSYGIKIDSLPPLNPSTHYGPSGHAADAGKQIEFRAQVIMQDDLGNGIIDCLGKAGFTVPQKGPVPGVEVKWMNADILGESIEDYGTVRYQPADEKTGPDGIETAIFTPNNEQVPGIGPVVTVQGGYEPRALWGTSFGNLIGSISQLLTPKLGSEVRWTVTYHKPRGFTFDPTTITFTSTIPGGTQSTLTSTITGHLCGTDILGKPWDLHNHEVNTFPGIPPETHDSDATVQLADGVAVHAGPPGTGATMTWSHTDPTHLVLYWKAPTMFAPAEQTISLTLRDDPSCPAP